MASMDFEIYQNHKDNLPSLVTVVYNKYIFLIRKRASLTQRCSKNRYLAEDFISDTYENLFYHLKRINPVLINPETFSFYFFVKHAIGRSLLKQRKNIKNESLIIEDPENERNYEEYFGSSDFEMPIQESLKSFYSVLNPRQREILKDKQNGVHEKKTRARMKISHGTYNRNVRLAKKIFKEFF